MAVILEKTQQPADSAPSRAHAEDAYERFSASRAWAGRRPLAVSAWYPDGDSETPAASPAVASAYAEAIVRFWEAALRTGAVDPQKPVYVLEGGAGCGRRTWLFMRELQARLSASRCGLSMRYVAIDRHASDLDFVASHPYLAGAVGGGTLDTAVWDDDRGGEIFLRNGGLALARTDNPVVAICHGLFGRLRQDLFGLHYGRILEGRVACAAEPQADGGSRLDYDWQPIDRADWLPEAWGVLLERYAARLNSASVTLPSGAMRFVDHLAQLSGGRYLLISADKGAWSEQQIRLGAAAPPERWPAKGDRLPVNYHALDRYQSMYGAKCWSGQWKSGGVVLHAALRDDSGQLERGVLDGIASPLDAVQPDDSSALRQIALSASLDAEQILALLRLSRFDPRVLQASSPRLLDPPLECGGESLWEWRAALERVWANYYPCGDPDPFCFNLGLLALHLGCWGLAKAVYRMQIAVYGEDATVLLNLASSEAASGGAARAAGLVERALQLEPDHAPCRELHALLSERLARWKRLAWFRPETALEGDLVLEPLGVEHAAELRYQYRDPQIGLMTRLPELKTFEEIVAWIGEQMRERGRMAYAVVHRDWGFVGTVSLHCDAGAGYFHFWIGSDYQGAGFGQRAARLLFEQAGRSGVREIFTSVYADNARSLKALAGLEFMRLRVSALPPDDDLIFFHRPSAGGAAAAEETAVGGLLGLCAAIDSPLKFSVDDGEGARQR